MKINCGYKYRIYPTKEQEKLLNHYFFVSNQAYNVCLDYQKETWERNRELPKAVGIDINVENIAFSNGFKLMTKSKLIAKTKYDKKIKRLKGKQSRRILRSKSTKTPLGKNFKKCQKKVCRIYDRASSIKRDSLHKISNAIVNNFDAIAVDWVGYQPSDYKRKAFQDSEVIFTSVRKLSPF